MQIGIDARAALWYRGSGIGTYTYQLIRELLAADPINQYKLVYPPSSWVEVRDGFHLAEGKYKNRNFWREVQLPPDWDGMELSIYHNPHNGIGLPPIGYRRPRLVVTIHDLIPFVLPQTCSKHYLEIALRELPRAVEAADYIIAVSFSTKQDLVRILGVPEEKIAVIYEAAEPIYRPISREEARQHVADKLGITEPYILNVGGFSRRKNLISLVRVFRRIRAELPQRCQLVLVGGAGGGSYEELSSLVVKWGLEEEVKFPGFVAQEDMPYLYSAAELFVYPSLYEGFGLPPLEAMACGVPVVAAAAASIPEVVEDGGLLYNPYDEDSLAEAVVKVMTDGEFRERLVLRGYRQKAKFSWTRAAAETWMVYQALAQQPQQLGGVSGHGPASKVESPAP
ncbi:MAG TPA: glycosyltransferase family 4 protein [Firmicutes bacterium]|nr:glycosyltransferase family 4 protein [Bacillota bacterium]